MHCLDYLDLAGCACYGVFTICLDGVCDLIFLILGLGLCFTGVHLFPHFEVCVCGH